MRESNVLGAGVGAAIVAVGLATHVRIEYPLGAVLAWGVSLAILWAACKQADRDAPIGIVRPAVGPPLVPQPVGPDRLEQVLPGDAQLRQQTPCRIRQRGFGISRTKSRPRRRQESDVVVQRDGECLVVVPAASGFALDTEHEVEMIAQDGVSADANGEDFREPSDPFEDPVLAVLEVASGGLVPAAKEGAAHAATDACLPDEATGEVGW